MKLTSHRQTAVVPNCGLRRLCALCLFAALAVLPSAAQEKRERVAEGDKTESAAAQDGETARERRAQAYAKLLEGQRYYADVRTGNLSVETVRRAQQAFQRAAELDPNLAEAHTALAELALYVLDDQAQAEREGRRAVQINPDNFGGHRVLSRVYTLRSRLGDESFDRAFAEKAIAALKEVIRISPSDAEAWALTAEFHLKLGREREAIEALETWSTLPASIEGRFYQLVTRGRELTPDAANARLAELHLKAGRTSEALAAIRRALAIEPENQRYLELLRKVLEATGSADRNTINELRSIVSHQPQNVAAVSLLAQAQENAGRVDDAAATLRAGLAALRPENEREKFNLRLKLAQVYENAHRHQEAVAAYEDLMASQNIKDAPLASEWERRVAAGVLSSISSIWQSAGQEAKALAAIERMRRLLGAEDPAADIQHVTLLRNGGKRKQALDAVRTARQRFPDNAHLLQLEVFSLADVGRVDEAAALLRARMKGESSDFNDYLLLASLLSNAKRGKEAVDAANKAVALASPNSPRDLTNALIVLSSAQESAGDTKGSEESLRRILAKEPNNATALNNLGYFLTERNERLDEALEMIQRAVNSEPTNPSFLDSLGWVYFKLGKLKEAEKYLSDAARRNPASATIQEHLGDLFQRLGQPEKARAAWQKALSLTVETADAERIKAKLNGETSK